MKKAFALILALIMVLTVFCSCGKKADTSAADTYLSMAQDFLEKNDVDSAIDILNKGFAETKDARLSEKLVEIYAQRDNAEPTEQFSVETLATTAPATKPKATKIPSTKPAATKAPTTKPIVTKAPSTNPVTTHAPTTKPVVTQASTTNPDTNQIPATKTTTPPVTTPSATTIQDIPVETILFDKISLSMMVGDTDLLGVTVYPFNATNQVLLWESSDSNIVAVDNAGNLTAIASGSATISAHSLNGVYAVDCQVFVKTNPILTCNDFPLHLYSDDGKDYLGKLVTNEYDSDSIWNEYGTYGSKYQTNSIWNDYGKYGSKYQSTSAFNPYATKPPVIVTNSGKVIGYLTASEYKLNGYTIIQLEQTLKKIGQ